MPDYVASYRNYLQNDKHASANTLSSYIRDVNQFRDWLIGQGFADLKKVKKDFITKYLENLNAKGKSPATITRSTASLKSFYGYMVMSGFMKSNPAKGVASAKVERKYPEILTNREVELFLEQPKCVDEKGYRDHAMLELLYATGIRVSELIGLNVSTSIWLPASSVAAAGEKSVLSRSIKRPSRLCRITCGISVRD